MEQTSLVLLCAACGLPWARVLDGKLVVTSRHHGSRHANGVDLDDLQRAIGEGQREVVSPHLESECREPC